MTREYVRSVIDMLSEEQFNKIVIILQQENFTQENAQEEQKTKKVLTAKGALNKYANPEMIPFEKDAWERTIVENYAEKYERCKNALENDDVKEYLERILKK